MQLLVRPAYILSSRFVPAPFLAVALLLSCAAIASTAARADAPATPPVTSPATAPTTAHASIKTLIAVKKIVAKSLDINICNVAADSKFVEDLGADASDLTELFAGLEDGFDLEIPDADSATLTTVQEAADYVEKKVAEKAAAAK